MSEESKTVVDLAEQREAERWSNILNDAKLLRRQNPVIPSQAILEIIEDRWPMSQIDREDLLDFLVITEDDGQGEQGIDNHEGYHL